MRKYQSVAINNEYEKIINEMIERRPYLRNKKRTVERAIEVFYRQILIEDADFYQGRISQSIGNNHYLGKQALADKHYSDKLIPYFSKMYYLFEWA